MLFFIVRFNLILALVFGFSLGAQAQQKPNPMASPNEFVQQIADQFLIALKNDKAARGGDLKRINQIVDEMILPYVNFEKTTRLAAGRNWREATAEQKIALSNAFRGTLARTYSGAVTSVNDSTSIKTLPFRGDANASDVVVKAQVTQHANSQPFTLDYRLEKTPQGWKIYDINVENVWLIENYRNQFTQQINQNGIDGLIAALNKRAQ